MRARTCACQKNEMNFTFELWKLHVERTKNAFFWVGTNDEPNAHEKMHLRCKACLVSKMQMECIRGWKNTFGMTRPMLTKMQLKCKEVAMNGLKKCIWNAIRGWRNTFVLSQMTSPMLTKLHLRCKEVSMNDLKKYLWNAIRGWKNTFGLSEMTSPMLTKMHVEMQGSRHEWLQKMHLECHSGLDKYIWVVTHDEPKFTKMHLKCKEVSMNGLRKYLWNAIRGWKNTFGLSQMTSPMLTKMLFEMQGSRHEWSQHAAGFSRMRSRMSRKCICFCL